VARDRREAAPKAEPVEAVVGASAPAAPRVRYVTTTPVTLSHALRLGEGEALPIDTSAEDIASMLRSGAIVEAT
jgi:hypothetical protein